MAYFVEEGTQTLGCNVAVAVAVAVVGVEEADTPEKEGEDILEEVRQSAGVDRSERAVVVMMMGKNHEHVETMTLDNPRQVQDEVSLNLLGEVEAWMQ
jgi:hypothetical protein